MPPRIWWLSISSLVEVQTYWPKFNLSRENIEISAFCEFIKILNLNEFGRCGRHVICPRDRLDMFYFTGEFDWPTYSTVWVMVKKPILRSYSLNLFAPIGFSGKVDFFKIAVINPFMNRFQKGLLIPRGHVNCKITHHSDIDISKFHSRLFCVIGFFRYAPKISLICRKFFSIFFLSCWFFE